LHVILYVKVILLIALLLASLCGFSQGNYIIGKKYKGQKQDYHYLDGEKLVIGLGGKKMVGVFFVENDSLLRLNDTLYELDKLEWIMVKRRWADRIAEMGLKWGTTYFLTFTINDWYRTGNPFDTRFTARNSGILMAVGAMALGVSMKKCKPINYSFFLIE
jgi:hypothetical protein